MLTFLTVPSCPTCKAGNSRSYLSKLNQIILEKRLFSPKKRIAIAVSGGQDSTVLLHILYKLHHRWNWQLSLVHCDHQWVPLSIDQSKHVYRLASGMHLPYYQATTLQVVLTEQRARVWRYQSLGRICGYHGYPYVSTAHSADDRIETLLYHLSRGSGFSGLHALSWQRISPGQLFGAPWGQFNKELRGKSIQWKVSSALCMPTAQSQTIQLIRPLLFLSRFDLQKCKDAWDLPVWSDPTNSALGMQRNRIRHQLLPYLRQYLNPRVDFAFNHLAELAYAESAYIDSLTHHLSQAATESPYYAKAKVCTPRNLINMQAIMRLPLALQRRCIKQILAARWHISLHFEEVERIRITLAGTCSQSSRDSPGQVSLPQRRVPWAPGTIFLLSQQRKICVYQSYLWSLSEYSSP